MEIKLFGPGCPRCKEMENIVTTAVKDSGVAADIKKITDFKEMMAHGVMSTPAVSIDGKLVCTGHVPTVAEVKEWLVAGAKK